ncbi:hypothetical protein V8E54_003404 [Elaphomyces granulatus]
MAYLYSAPAAYDTPMFAAYAAIAVGSPDACVRNANSTTSFLTALRLLAMSMVNTPTAFLLSVS